MEQLSKATDFILRTISKEKIRRSPCELPKPARSPRMDVEGRCMMSVAHRQPLTSAAAPPSATDARCRGHLDRRTATQLMR